MPTTKPAREPEGPPLDRAPARPAANYALPASIAFGSIVIAIGLYAGLGGGRARAPASSEPATTSASSASTPAAPSAAAPRTASPSQPPSEQALSEMRRRVTADARTALEAQRAALTAACWAKAAAKSATPATASFVYSIAFAADGREMGRAVSEAKNGERPEVADCLRITVTPIAVPPPGQPVMVKVTIALP